MVGARARAACRDATMPSMRSAVSRFAPPLALMALIFFLSAQPDLNSGLGTLDTVLRKLAHMAEFGLLWLLWWRALGARHAAAAVAITLLYAASDELHQHFVEGRHGSVLDWCIDAAGVGLAGLAVVLRARRRRACSEAEAAR
jgi:VanZ family protein